MIPIINDYFISKGFRQIVVNVENINLYYMRKEAFNYLVALFYMENGDEFTGKQFKSIIDQVNNKVFDISNIDNNLRQEHINIIITNHIDKVKPFLELDNHIWFISKKENRIMRYEYECSDFLQLYEGLDKLLLNHNIETMNAIESIKAAGTNDSAGTNEAAESIKTSGSKHESASSKLIRKWPFSICNTIIVAINIIIFLIMDLFGLHNIIFEAGELFWPSVLYDYEYYRLITSMFVHSGIDHLLNNMLILLFIGDNLEKNVGKIKYLLIYFTTGIIAGIVSMRYNMVKGEMIGSIGASGAIFGVIGAVAFTVFINRKKTYDFSKRRMIFFIFLSLYGGFVNQGVDNAAHIGGLIAGVICSVILTAFASRK